ncbi:PKS-NRPS hybrid synthetase [Fusarium oxysporum f. sp. conglutinans]|nr:PKS-NRPS hybrid synthetase [Fusarium oxysporum f. sp. conglutinans]
MIRTFTTSQSEPPSSSESNPRCRTRSPSPSDQLQARKRRRQSRQSRFSPPLLANRPRSASSIGTSISQYYGVGDEDILGNLFASYPQTFSTAPQPYESQGLHELPWELRFDYEIYLSNDFLTQGRRQQRVRIPIPRPETDLLPSSSPPQSAREQSSPTKAEFQSALKLVREVIGTDRKLTLEPARSYERVRQWREKWGYSPLSSDALEPPPPYSPPREPSTQAVSPQKIRSSPLRISSSPAPDPIPNPPIPGDPAPSAEALFDLINTFAKESGFGIVRRNAYLYNGRRMRYSFQCDRYGEPRPSRGAGLRQRKSRKATIESTSRRVGTQARNVRAVVQEQHPELTFTQRDIYNAWALINRDKLNGYTPTAALIKLFDEMDVPYVVKWADDELSRLVGLVWTFSYCLQMWKRFPEVISFDNIYNTNRFKLPLFQATGQTCLGSVFNAAFEQHSICQPDVIVTDFDDQIKAALNDQFPDVQQQLCIHHINSNVLLKSKQKWVKGRSSSSSPDSSDEDKSTPQVRAELSPKDRQLVYAPTSEDIPHSYRGVLMMWKLVLFAETEDAHEKAWRNLCREFDDQRAILWYLHRTYMPYRNFGIRVTSGTEASNNIIKSYLLNGMSHLYRLVEAMQDMMKDQERDFNDACAADEVLTAREYIGSSSEYLGELRTAISSKGLGLINKQYCLARKAMPTGKNPFPEPLGAATTTVRSLSSSVYLVATALRGRPKNTTQAVPARLAIGASNRQSSQPASQGPLRRRRGRLPGSLNRSTLARVELDASQHASSQASSSNQCQKRSQSGTLGAGRTTGGRASGRKTQPSIRRRRSQ